MRIIIVTKRQIAGVSVFILAIALCVGALALYNTWGYHRHFPDPDSYAWEAETATVFTPAKEGYSVLIDLDTMMLTLYKDGEAYNAWPVSGGKKDTPSPTGQWKVSGVGTWGEGFGGSWIALNVPWGKYGIHGTVEPWAVGSRNISHGCIRMKNADAAALRKHIAYGTPVYIKQDDAPFRALSDGMVGSDVQRLQQMLYAAGYYGYNADGRFGYGTGQALRSFQKEEGIRADGVAGWQTWERLCLRSGNLLE